MKRAAWLALAVAAAGGSYLALRGTGTAPPPAKQPRVPGECQSHSFGGKRFTECIAVPGRHAISTRITGSDGIIYRGFARLARDVDPRNVAFAFNGGMYDTGSKPIGYYAENGERLYPLNTLSGEGNFYLKPNGVFFGETYGSWRVTTSEDFAAEIVKRPEFGTQSGPMLLIRGEFNSHFSPQGTSAKRRNAVGVDAQGRAHFVISEEPVTFGWLARLMRDHAQVSDALYLDGEVSSLWYPASGRMDGRYPLGPMIVVTRVGVRPSR